VGREALEWERYIHTLKTYHVRIKESEDELIWGKNPAKEVYIPKTGYQALNSYAGSDEGVWWWKCIWKYKCPLKSCIFMWLALKNKVLTWENLKKGGKHGLGWCYLCQSCDESIAYLLLFCPFPGEVWKEVGSSIGIRVDWSGISVDSY
jgi:hypothetical protein